ncbi:ribulose 1,5-bisphosphate carboxylase large subunit [Rhodococcus sp. CH91]|uniref:ribulose 1,5-bisphosphate carboxylase large subunit n=1 Tax=Rhodococcus sp. CH91 TaxID=2910256 RepID=UPI001F4BC767|nr:ribulose 1,5-bisphosphate carboxylase large subunit [Rhodococcus sp. CH91]
MISLPVPALGLSVAGSIVDVARTAVQRTLATAEFALSVPARVENLLDEAESLVDTVGSLIRRIDTVVTDATEIVEGASVAVAQATQVIASTIGVVEEAADAVMRATEIIDSTGGVVRDATLVASDARVVVESAGRSSDAAEELLGIYRPLAEQAAPLATRFVEEFSPAEVHAAVQLIDMLPVITERVDAVLPIMATLDTVAPEIHELLLVAKDVRQAIVGVPGFNFLRRRGEEKEISGDD